MIDWTRVITPADARSAAAADLRERIKARRDEAMNAGISIGGMPVATDDTSQNRLSGAALSAFMDPAYSLRWKTSDGSFIDLDAAQVIAIATAVRAHVQACFSHEADLLAAINADGSPDIDAGWPGQVSIRLHHDRAEGANHERTGTGIYRLTGGDAHRVQGDFPGPLGMSATAVWIDGALTVWVRDAAGALADIPDDRWITLTGGT